LDGQGAGGTPKTRWPSWFARQLDYLTKVVANFSPKIASVCVNCDDQKQFEFNVSVVSKRKSWQVLVTENFDAALLF
jgi:hypothetical protein